MPSSLFFIPSFICIYLIFSVISVASNSTSSFSSTPCQRHLAVREKRQVFDTYYDFLINEWSFKFWAVFQLVTIAVLLYSTFAAIYYAKWTYLRTEPTEDDLLFRKRSLDAGISRWGEG